MAVDVLIVDDSAAVRKILQRVLNQAGVPVGKVYEATNGVEALESLRADPVGLILSDINMPHMDGLELLGRIRAESRWANVPVVIITTEGGQAKVMEAVRLGASGYLRKPFTTDQIREKLNALIQVQ